METSMIIEASSNQCYVNQARPTLGLSSLAYIPLKNSAFKACVPIYAAQCMGYERFSPSAGSQVTYEPSDFTKRNEGLLNFRETPKVTSFEQAE